MATIDMTHRKLNFPPRFLPYLEKHRIFELFHECVELLVQVKPRDHIKFLKNVLPCAAMKKDKQRVVFLSPPWFDRVAFSEILADCLGIQCMNRSLLEMLTREKRDAEKIKIEVLSESVEEESCICPGEAQFSRPGLYYSPAGEGYDFLGEADIAFDGEGETEEEGEREKKEEEEQKGEEPPEEEPCICVCPCVKKAEEKEAQAEAKEKEVKSDAGGGKLGDTGSRRSETESGTASELTEDQEGEGEKAYNGRADGNKAFGGDSVEHAPMVEISPSEESGQSLLEIDWGILADCEQSSKGWILEDFPGTGEEAERLNTLGVIPTHAIRIINDERAEERNTEYQQIVKGWMKAYKYVPVLEIQRRDRNLQQLAKDMCKLLSVMPHRHAPMLPRVVLIGSRGSGVTTQGQKLARKYGMVHVEFELVISRALQQDDELCKMYKVQLATNPDPELEALLLERALLTSMCRNRGWVLTGYPRNIDQMRMLDIIATPPNRVIFIEVPARECFVRLYYRKIDPCLGDEYKIPTILPTGMDSYEAPDLDPEVAKRLVSHPKNNRKQIIHDIEEHFLNKEDMMNYCGKTASYVDGNQEVDRVFEQIEQVLINPAPPHPPRNPLEINYGIGDSYERLKKFRLSSGMFFNNMLLNPPERTAQL